ncbi:HK97 family phage prohead protease [Mycolicibacterium sphagni]|uniref:HK97 family phage prohead protease n=1 Tax=Mycolicibacterium sphagni TaxID=1786 RepID=UPI0021F25C87|nr:HK97 family phage prohead protease [Mycolicibacterium sphagni]MCV7174788.1 HK97 family phage prohead protease [Mycolicibacterium sphagni]
MPDRKVTVETDGPVCTVSGYAYVFDDVDRPSIAPDVLRRAVSAATGQQHIDLKIMGSRATSSLASTKNEKLTLWIDEQGLRVHGRINPATGKLLEDCEFAIAFQTKSLAEPISALTLHHIEIVRTAAEPVLPTPVGGMVWVLGVTWPAVWGSGRCGYQSVHATPESAMRAVAKTVTAITGEYVAIDMDPVITDGAMNFDIESKGTTFLCAAKHVPVET